MGIVWERDAWFGADKIIHLSVHFTVTVGLGWLNSPLLYAFSPAFGLWWELVHDRGGSSWKDLVANSIGWLGAIFVMWQWGRL